MTVQDGIPETFHFFLDYWKIGVLMESNVEDVQV